MTTTVATEPGADGFGGGTTVKASSAAWNVGSPGDGVLAGSVIFNANSALICDEGGSSGGTTELMVSSDQSEVVSGDHTAGYFSIEDVHQNNNNGFVHVLS